MSMDIGQQPLWTVDTLKAAIVMRGVTPAAGGPGGANGHWDIQQNPEELAIFLAFCEAQGVQRVLELGTGAHGGLARFMAVDMEWSVTSVDVNAPTATAPGITFMQGRTDELYSQLAGQRFDLVFIDACHHYDCIAVDHRLYGPMGRIVAFHDVAAQWSHVEPDAPRYWRDVAYDNGRLKPMHFEAIGRNPSIGIGWYVNA